MANLKHLDIAIAVMERAKIRGTLNMENWQTYSGDNCAYSEEQLHACGNTACFAGHLAIAPECRETGVRSNHAGNIVYDCDFGSYAVAKYLEIPYNLAHSLVMGDLEGITRSIAFSTFYNKLWSKVTADDVLEKLYAIRDNQL